MKPPGLKPPNHADFFGKMVPEVGIVLARPRCEAPTAACLNVAFGTKTEPSEGLVPEVGIEPTRGVNPTGF
jgi:hypothetical protein